MHRRPHGSVENGNASGKKIEEGLRPRGVIAGHEAFVLAIR